MPVNGKPNGRFELPALTPITFSLTEGTDIPPPVDSPVEEKVSAPAPTNATSAQTASDSATNGHNETSNGAYDGRGRSSGVDAPPLSPTSTTKPSSIRRLFSRKSLNQNYTHSTNNNGSDEHLDAAKIQRPESSMSFLDRPGQAEKKRGSWFKRLGSANGSKRSSVIFEPKPVQQAPAPVKKGPPPPKLPELNRLKAKVDNDVGSLGGGDMFKNIK